MEEGEEVDSVEGDVLQEHQVGLVLAGDEEQEEPAWGEGTRWNQVRNYRVHHNLISLYPDNSLMMKWILYESHSTHILCIMY